MKAKYMMDEQLIHILEVEVFQKLQMTVHYLSAS